MTADLLTYVSYMVAAVSQNGRPVHKLEDNKSGTISKIKRSITELFPKSKSSQVYAKPPANPLNLQQGPADRLPSHNLKQFENEANLSSV